MSQESENDKSSLSTQTILIIELFLVCLIGLVGFIYFWTKSRSKDNDKEQGGPVRRDDPVNQRRQQALNQRARLRANARVRHVDNEEEDVNEEDEVNRPLIDFDDKMGTKKRAKLEAKAEKKVQREAEQKFREDKKKKDAQADEERKKLDEKERLEELKKKEEERLLREEQERKEEEEYLLLKAGFNVEEEGFEEGEESESDNLLQEFIQYIKDTKVVVLEDLAALYKLKTQAVIDRIVELKNNGSLTGVIDDRGKFIYISVDEINSVADFIKSQGRISIADLAKHSNTLISLDSKTV